MWKKSEKKDAERMNIDKSLRKDDKQPAGIRKMIEKKTIRWKLALMSASIIMLSACGIATIKEQKIQDVPYSIVRKDEVPEELKQEIETAKKTEMWLSYADREKGKGDLYIVRGYGMQENAGYSIKVDSCYETANTLVVRTTLLGPEKEKNKKHTYPYIVIKTAYTEKQIVYE